MNVTMSRSYAFPSNVAVPDTGTSSSGGTNANAPHPARLSKSRLSPTQGKLMRDMISIPNLNRSSTENDGPRNRKASGQKPRSPSQTDADTTSLIRLPRRTRTERFARNGGKETIPSSESLSSLMKRELTDETFRAAFVPIEFRIQMKAIQVGGFSNS